MAINVLKRDGSSEEFHPEKIIRVLLGAGLEEDSALVVAQKVNDWAKGQPDQQITSLQIRDKISEELQKIDPYIYGLYAWYQTSKDRMYSKAP